MPSVPRGYWSEEYPLPHDNKGHFALSAITANKNATILPIFRSTEELINPENVQVNPRNTGFAEENGLSTYIGSIMPRTRFSFTVMMTENAVETAKLREIVFYWFPIYTAFMDSVEAEDSKTGTLVKDVLELSTTSSNKSVRPIFNGTDLGSQNIDKFSSGVETFADWNLTTDDKIEGVEFNLELLHRAIRYFTNKGMLKQALGRIRRVVLNRDRSYNYFSNNFTYPRVKRSNEFMFCGAMFFTPRHDGTDNSKYGINNGNTLGTGDHIIINYHTQFSEWNSNFDQGAQ